MKKITFLLCIVLLSSFTAMAQYSFPVVTGPTNVASGATVILNINDAANAAGVPAGVYETFSVSVDWISTNNAWASEADLEMVTSAGTVSIDPPTTGSASSGAATTLTFEGTFVANYDPSSNGTLDIVLNQSYSGSSADWSNITVTIVPAVTCTSPVATAVVGTTDCAAGTYMIDVDVTSLGDATSVTITNDAGVSSTPATATGMVSVGPFTPGTDVNITIEHDQDSLCNLELATLSYACPPSNDECTGAIPLTVNGDLDCMNVTSGTIAAATASGIATACGGTEDDDVWYSFMATSTSHVIALQNITGGTTDLYHAVYDATSGCEALGTALTCSDPNTSTTSGLTVGTTYFVQVYSWTGTAGQTSNFDICIGTPPPPPVNDACENAITINAGDSISGDTSYSTNVENLTVCSGGTVGTTCDPGGDSSPNAGTLVFGTGVWYVYNSPGNESISVEDSAGAFDSEIQVWSGACGSLVCVAGDDDSSNVGSGGFVCFDSETTPTTYYIYIDGNAATGTGAYTLNLNTTPLAPANDECANAEALTLGVMVTGDTTNATDSGIAAGSCGATGGDQDIWYSFVATATMAVNVNTTADTVVIYDTCGGTEISCVGEGSTDVDGLTDGTTYYARAYNSGTAKVAGPVNITISETTLSTRDFNGNTIFSYYPNPVNNTLTLNAQQAINNVTIFNMLGQEVIRTAPNAVSKDVDMSNLQSGAYFVQVTVGNAVETVKIIKN